jgi:hypothetical protein
MASLQRKSHGLQTKVFLKIKSKPAIVFCNFGCYAEVFEEALVRRPKLAQHGFFHALL